MSTRRGRTARQGFTLVEIMVAMTLTLAVFAITLPFVRAQTRALGATAGRMDADQLARYAQRAIDRDLRLAGSDEGQPLLVYAGSMGIAFNANLLAEDDDDPNALDVEGGAATTLTESWRLSDAGALPFGGRNYPTQDYLDADGGVSRNETIAYFLHPDTISGRDDLYVLYRRVNKRDSVQVVRALQVSADSAFFTYFRPSGDSLLRVAAARLPFYWDSTAIDSVTAVGLRATGFYRDRMTAKETMRTVYWRSGLTNGGSRVGTGCDGAPSAADDVRLTKQVNGPGHYRVEVTWEKSDDDGAGTSGVRHYIVERQRASGTWMTVATIPATGADEYEWHHAQPGDGNYTYGVRAVDCAGNVSARDTDTVTLP